MSTKAIKFPVNNQDRTINELAKLNLYKSGRISIVEDGTEYRGEEFKGREEMGLRMQQACILTDGVYKNGTVVITIQSYMNFY